MKQKRVGAAFSADNFHYFPSPAAHPSISTGGPQISPQHYILSKSGIDHDRKKVVGYTFLFYYFRIVKDLLWSIFSEKNSGIFAAQITLPMKFRIALERAKCQGNILVEATAAPPRVVYVKTNDVGVMYRRVRQDLVKKSWKIVIFDK